MEFRAPKRRELWYKCHVKKKSQKPEKLRGRGNGTALQAIPREGDLTSHLLLLSSSKISIYVYAPTYMCVYVSVLDVCVYAYISGYMNVCNMLVYVSVCMCIYVFIGVQCVHVHHMCVHVHTHVSSSLLAPGQSNQP